jgi:hypothetical protein
MNFPVFKAFSAGLAYIVAHFFTIVKILWLPTLLLMAVQVYLMPSMIDAQVQLGGMEQGGDPTAMFAAMGPMMRTTALLYVAMAILYPMMIAGLLRHVIRGEAPRLPFYLWFGADELRIVAAFLLLIIMAIILGIAGFLSVMVVGLTLSLAAGALGGILMGFAPLVLLGVLIWFFIRMSIVYAATVGERTVGVAESWNITAGHFWGLFFYWILWALLMIVITLIFFALISPAYMPFMMEMMSSMSDPSAMEQVETRMLEMQRDMWDLSRPGAWLSIISTYLFTMVYTAMWVVPAGIAYRYLVGEERTR